MTKKRKSKMNLCSQEEIDDEKTLQENNQSAIMSALLTQLTDKMSESMSRMFEKVQANLESVVEKKLASGVAVRNSSDLTSHNEGSDNEEPGFEMDGLAKAPNPQIAILKGDPYLPENQE